LNEEYILYPIGCKNSNWFIDYTISGIMIALIGAFYKGLQQMISFAIF